MRECWQNSLLTLPYVEGILQPVAEECMPTAMHINSFYSWRSFRSKTKSKLSDQVVVWVWVFAILSSCVSWCSCLSVIYLLIYLSTQLSLSSVASDHLWSVTGSAGSFCCCGWSVQPELLGWKLQITSFSGVNLVVVVPVVSCQHRVHTVVSFSSVINAAGICDVITWTSCAFIVSSLDLLDDRTLDSKVIRRLTYLTISYVNLVLHSLI